MIHVLPFSTGDAIDIDDGPVLALEDSFGSRGAGWVLWFPGQPQDDDGSCDIYGHWVGGLLAEYDRAIIHAQCFWDARP